jgi:hypothetical protein
VYFHSTQEHEPIHVGLDLRANWALVVLDTLGTIDMIYILEIPEILGFLEILDILDILEFLGICLGIRFDLGGYVCD